MRNSYERNSQIKKIVLVTLLALFAFVLSLNADVVVLKQNDTRLTGSVQELENDLILTPPNGAIKTIHKSDIKEIITEKQLLKEFKDKQKKSGKKNVKELETLANWAFNNGLDEQGRLVLKNIIKINPDNEAARNSLGQIKKDNKWIDPLEENSKYFTSKGFKIYKNKFRALDVKQNKKWKFTPEEIKAHSDFNNAWYVLSDHYLLKTNVPPDNALELINNLEEVYNQFYGIFRSEFNLSDIKEVMKVNIFATQAEYDTYATRRWGAEARGTTGFFLAQEQNLTTFVQPTLKQQLMHEGFHQLLHHTMNLTNINARSKSTWVHEGIARYFENSQWKDNKVVKAGDRNETDINIIKKSIEANAYPRLKEFVSSDFTFAKFNQFFAVCYAFASSYTEFLITYQNGKYFKGFCKHFETVRNGRESIAQFEKDLNVKVDDLQKEWLEWVKSELKIQTK